MNHGKQSGGKDDRAHGAETGLREYSPACTTITATAKASTNQPIVAHAPHRGRERSAATALLTPALAVSCAVVTIMAGGSY
jgi:hypothetical protein